MNEHEIYRRPTYESGAMQRDREIIAAATDWTNIKTLVQSFADHRQSIREHEESRRAGK